MGRLTEKITGRNNLTQKNESEAKFGVVAKGRGIPRLLALRKKAAGKEGKKKKSKTNKSNKRPGIKNRH